MQVVQSPSGRPVTREDGTGLGLGDFSSMMASIGDTFTKVAPSIATIYTTQAQLKQQANIARMQMAQGQYPTGSYPPQQNVPMTGAGLSGMMMPLMLGGVALAAVLLLRK